MIIYNSTKRGFVSDVMSGRIETIVEEKFIQRLNRRVSESEKRSWANSMKDMCLVLQGDYAIHNDCGVAIEFTLPPTSKRIDFLISGVDESQKSSVIIIELKQWENCERTSLDAIVRTFLGGTVRDTIHPSYQAYSYQTTLSDFNEAVYTGEVTLQSCAFLHNMTETQHIKHPHYSTYLSQSPVFLKTEMKKLQDYISNSFVQGDHGLAIKQIENGRIKPSVALSKEISKILKGNKSFTLLDDQKLVFEKCLEQSLKYSGTKNVVIVRGGPGTGKSVVAINILVSLISKRRNAAYVSKNAAPREVYQDRLFGAMTKSRFKTLFLGSGKFMDTLEEKYDCLIVDEAHRLNEKSGLYGNLGENQVKEIIESTNTSIFFLDEDQRVALSDIGSFDEISGWANHFGAEVLELNLQSQFRCSGSDAYMAWLDNTLGIRDTAHQFLDKTDYQFDVMSSPLELHEKIKSLNEDKNSARIVAGYCYRWVSKKDPLAFDIEFPFFDYRAKWNLASHGSTWIENPDSVTEVGCIHTCQGLEVDHIGVIIGRDMIFSDGEVKTDYLSRDRHDKTMKGSKKMVKEYGEQAIDQLDTLIRNTYRTLMTRGMKSCSIWCEDPALNDYFKRVIGR